ncbi:MAG TPA: hypothetical protein VMF57_02360 [Solirubrobacteraceae bacterium]|nr:hypothetical protein [Solirubrobacteraceae bacterium]
MSGFEDFERQLLDAIARRAPRRVRRASTLIVAASSALVVAVAALAIVLLGHRKTPSPSPSRPPAVSPPPKTRTSGESSVGGMQILFRMPHASLREARYIDTALFGVGAKEPACSLVAQPNPAGATISQATPDAALLSALGVLRRPATAADRLPAPVDRAGHPLLLGEPNQVYVRYIRLARIVDGVGYYLVPGLIGSPPPPARVMSRCYAQEMRALRVSLAHVSPTLRAATLKVGAQTFARARASVAKRRPFEGVVELNWQLNGRGGGGSGGGANAATIEQQGMLGGTGSAVYGVVPSGVAKVTLEWGGKRAPVTTGVVGNVFVVSAPAVAADFPPPKIVWLAANGGVIRTVSEP